MPTRYLNLCWLYVNETLGNKFQWNLNRISELLIQENAFENVVCGIVAILYRPQCINWCILWCHQTTTKQDRVVSTLYRLLTHCGWDKIAAISKTTFSNAFTWMKTYEFRLRCLWILSLRVELTVFQYCSVNGLALTSLLRYICVIRPLWIELQHWLRLCGTTLCGVWDMASIWMTSTFCDWLCDPKCILLHSMTNSPQRKFCFRSENLGHSSFTNIHLNLKPVWCYSWCIYASVKWNRR